MFYVIILNIYYRRILIPIADTSSIDNVHRVLFCFFWFASNIEELNSFFSLIADQWAKHFDYYYGSILVCIIDEKIENRIRSK
jgi:hypothetical protein